MPSGKQQSTWAQTAGKGLNNNSTCDTSNNTTSSKACSSGLDDEHEPSGGSASKVMKMAETVNESQIAAAFSEGWGQRGVNQDTTWDVPSSPQCSPKEGSSWSGSTSTGTEIWENNIRHQSKGPNINARQMREPWGHAPTSHIGGTWGEEEDNTNVWTGVPQASTAPWGNESSTLVWGNNPQEGKTWGGQDTNMNSAATWGSDAAPPPPLQLGLADLPMINEAKNINLTQKHFEISSVDIDDNVPETGKGVWADPSHKQNFDNWSPITGGNKKIGPPSGWEETAVAPPPPVTCQSGPNYDDGTAVWGNPVHQGKVSRWKEMPPTKQMPNCIMPPSNLCNSGNPCTGPGMIRLPPSATNLNKNDTTWLKGSSLNRGISWTDMPNHRDTSGRRIWDDLHNPLQEKNVPGTPTTPNSAFGSWNDHAGNYFGAKVKNPSAGWADGQVDTSSWGGPMKQGGKPLSKDLIWASKQFRLLSELNFKKDDIENALRRSNMNLEEAVLELQALNSKDANAMEMDGMGLNMNQRIPHGVADEMNFSDQSLDNSVTPGNMYGSSNFPGMAMFSSGFNIAQNCKNQVNVGNNTAPNVLGNPGSNNPQTNFNLNNVSPAMMRKILQQSQTFNPACLPQNALNSQANRLSQQNFPSTAQLRHLVQQIQMAVHAGHLNPQILNQPLAPQTLQLLYQLLQQIRILHQFQQQHHFMQGTKNCSPPLQLSVQITQTKQHLGNLQNQIAAQQAIFLKQQNLQLPIQHPSLQTPQPSTFDVVKSNLDAINGLHMDFRDLSVKESSSQSHSRLNQWKLPTYDKEDANDGCHRDPGNGPNCPLSEFSRAPGSVSKSSSANSLSSTTAPHSSSGLQPLSENTWADIPHSRKDSWGNEPNDSSGCGGVSGNKIVGSGDLGCDGAPNKLNSASDKEPPATTIPSTTSSSQSTYNLNDLVPEFEPGKPWKGTSRIKNFEDDPHVTPGSIAKSPLSLNSIKDSELFTWNTKPNASSQNSSSASSLTTSTWSFSPPLAPPAVQNSVPGKPPGSKSWENHVSDPNYSWKGPMPKTRGPPPGLAGQGKSLSSNWMPNDPTSQNWSSNAGWEKQPGSNFLVLRNLTPQIDGSTLKTLCLQHGPLQLFHLLLNHGIALIHYSSREESEKARCALNNCVFSNTTILVDIPTESEVKQYLQLACGQNISWSQGGSSDQGFGANNAYTLSSSNSVGTANTTGGGGGGGSSSGGPTCKMNSDNWSSSTNLNLPGSNLWSCSGNDLWSMQSSGNDQDQGIPSSLNSFLPGDLLGGGESI